MAQPSGPSGDKQRMSPVAMAITAVLSLALSLGLLFLCLKLLQAAVG